jgi:two-component system chemotaxis sensor kinase CheA
MSMSSKSNQVHEELAEVIRLLADVWPNERDQVLVAGAKFEECIESIEESGSQLQRLIDLAWRGLKYLFEEKDYFISVKTATMNAVNTVREYLIQDGDITVEGFERSYEQLEKALSGKNETADEIIEVGTKPANNEEAVTDELEDHIKEKNQEPDGTVDGDVSLNDLAALIMTIDIEDFDEERFENLKSVIKSIADRKRGAVSDVLTEAYEKLISIKSSDNKKSEDWLTFISVKTEQALEIEENEEWGLEEPSSPEGDLANSVDPGLSENENSKQEVFTIPADTDVDMLGEFVTECKDLIETAESALLDLESNPEDEELINTVFRAFHTIKGTSAFMGLDPISEFTHSAENLLNMVRDGNLTFDLPCADVTLDSIDILKKLLEVVEDSSAGDPLPTDAAFDRMLRILNNISEKGDSVKEALEKEGAELQLNGNGSGEPADEIVNENGQPEKKEEPGIKESKGNKKSDSESTVRVNIGRLDRLIDMVGELVIAHSVVAQDVSIAQESALMKKVNHTSKILRELQDTSLTLRMVPLKATFHKMNRLVRDLARKAGKNVNFSTVGEDTEIDRNMVDIINEPLVHMLRNAIDHGIEEPADREKSGKETTANVWLRAYQESGKVVIEIEDDGKGIDKDKILQKGIEKGLVDPDRQLTESEIFSLIFKPGFSSVEKVTNLSGRGVGMDVVRRSIEQLNGKVKVTSTKGKGTKVTVELPFTLAITDGMLVRIGDQRFIIPTINIDMTFRAKENDLHTVLGKEEQVNFRGKSIPVLRLHKLFKIENCIDDLLKGTMLIIRNSNKQYALLVDEVIGQQQLVGKSINMIVKTPHISGGAILGDGRVGLILDTASIVN